MLVYPTLHYQNGGIRFDKEGRTSVPGLFGAGEVTGGIHGENRLMGNSLLDILVFGQISGKNAAHHALSGEGGGKMSLDHVRRYHRELDEIGIDGENVAPMLLPDYTNPEVRERQLTTKYLGTMR
jgi:succinate dehydrogenase/fumarate reductase flavoprotein subunit